MIARVVFIPLLLTILTQSCKRHDTVPEAVFSQGASVLLVPRSDVFYVDKVPQGTVEFTALIRNDGKAPITMAHPSLCFPADYKLGEIRRFSDSHGKSEILLKIRKPDGVEVILRDRCFPFFDPDNAAFITIPPNGTGTIAVGWFFQNARGRWEQDEVAAKVFLMKGKYKIRILFRNSFPKAALYDENTEETKFIDVWTGEMESPEITIEIK
jgi:hypothetical protein